MKLKLIALIAGAAVLAGGCALKQSPAEAFIKENVANAEVQLSSLLATCEAGDTLRIPSSYEKGEIKFVRKTGWVSGFFAGSLWYMYELTGEEKWAEHAQKHTENLRELQYVTTHHDVGFMVGSSFGNGLRLKGIAGYDTVIVNTAKSLSTRFKPAAGVLQSWEADKGWQAEKGWTCPVIIDNLMNLELLFKASELSGDPTFKQIAVSHLDKTLENHYREDASTWHVVDYDIATGEVLGKYTAQGYSDDSAWSRGQAWSLYGCILAYRFTKDVKYLERAKAVERFLFSHKNMPDDLVPYWDFDAPNIPDEPRDASSAAIIASALYELYGIVSDLPAEAAKYKAEADKILESLSTPAYRAEPGTNGGFLLMHSVSSLPHGNGIDVALNYADYYFLESLLRKRRIENGLPPVE